MSKYTLAVIWFVGWCLLSMVAMLVTDANAWGLLFISAPYGFVDGIGSAIIFDSGLDN